MSIKATHTPLTKGGLPQGPPSVRYDTSRPWPGILARHPLDWCDRCPRAYLGGILQVKYIDMMCEIHGLVRRALPPDHPRPLPPLPLDGRRRLGRSRPRRRKAHPRRAPHRDHNGGRAVSALFARHYRYVPPLPPSPIWSIREPYGPDPYVFGPGSSTQRDITPGYVDAKYRHCRNCQVRWRGGEPCFACGAHVPELTL